MSIDEANGGTGAYGEVLKTEFRHVAATYSRLRTIKSPPKGGLAPWQERRARDMLAEDLRSDQSLKDIAAAVGLSVSHFSRAFQQSTGLPPHRWQLRYRIELAKRLLDDATHSLVDIALAAGFADQSHFTRAFSSFVGASPGAWRRAREIGFDNQDELAGGVFDAANVKTAPQT